MKKGKQANNNEAIIQSKLLIEFQKLKDSIEKEERIFMRQHGFAAKKYEKSAAETREQMLIKAHMQRFL